ncbi:hypothetical protein [Polystyrenella longa]|nr:hypothetical protein [Polystyrenella longa]
MTTSGKIFVVIVILAGIVGLFLMARVTATHSFWIKAYEADETEMLAQRKQKFDRQLELERVNTEHDKLINRWYQTWADVNTVSNGDGSISIDAGSNQGLPAPGGNVPVVLYGFRPDPQNEGETVFVKSFKVTDVQNDRSTLTAEGYTTEEEIASWDAGNWRFWKMIPSSYFSTLSALDARRAETNFTLEIQQRSVAKQEELLTRAKKMLENRHLQLDGDPEFAGDDNLPIEIRVGYIKAIEQTQNEHLEILQEVDQLRREIKATTDEINELLTNNDELASRLPQ